MAHSKLSADLLQHLENSKDTEMLDIIIEVSPDENSNSLSEDSKLTRQERIAVRRDSFVQQSAPIETAVQEEGGEITDRAWINQTLKARIPAKAVKKISEQQNIYNLAIPRAIEKD